MGFMLAMSITLITQYHNFFGFANYIIKLCLCFKIGFPLLDSQTLVTAFLVFLFLKIFFSFILNLLINGNIHNVYRENKTFQKFKSFPHTVYAYITMTVPHFNETGISVLPFTINLECPIN